jgi:hypothetical protein
MQDTRTQVLHLIRVGLEMGQGQLLAEVLELQHCPGACIGIP